MTQPANWLDLRSPPWLALVDWSFEPKSAEQLRLFIVGEDHEIDLREIESEVPEDLRGMYFTG